MQANCVRKTGAVFFGGREIIRGNLTRAKSTRGIIETRSIIKPKTSCIIKNNSFLVAFSTRTCPVILMKTIAYVTVTLNKNIIERQELFVSVFSIVIIKGVDIR